MLQSNISFHRALIPADECNHVLIINSTIFHGCQKPLAVCYRNNSRLDNYRKRSSIKCLGTFRVNVFERYGVPQTAGRSGIK